MPLSVTIITLNEEANIAQAIQSVAWADEIVVVDSGSSDRTCEIAREQGARVLVNPWSGYGQQKNFAQAQARHPWVLNIDADERVSANLAEEIRHAIARSDSGASGAVGFSFPRKTYYLGRWIRHGGWYPNVLTRVTKRDRGRWTEPPVHEELRVEGEVVQLSEPLDHFAFSSIQDQILTNIRFSRLGSLHLRDQGQSASLVKLIFKPIGKFFETYFLKWGILDGIAGFIISVNAAHSMFLKYAYLFENRIRSQRENR